MRWLVLLACVGCGRLAFDPVELTSDAPGTDGPASSCTTSDFDVMPPGILTTGGGTAEAVNGRILVTVPGTNQVDVTVRAATSANYATRTTEIEVVSPSLIAGAQTAVGWHQVTPTRLGAHIEMDGVSLKFATFDEVAAQYTELLAVPFDPVEHAWWRLRAANGGLVAEVSRDGVAWNAFSVLPTYDTSNVYWDFGLGVYNGTIQATEATFDNLVDCVD